VARAVLLDGNRFGFRHPRTGLLGVFGNWEGSQNPFPYVVVAPLSGSRCCSVRGLRPPHWFCFLRPHLADVHGYGPFAAPSKTIAPQRG